MKKTLLAILPALLLGQMCFAQKWEGLAPTPQMGWNAWNTFGDNINEQLVRETADLMVDLGLVDAGYVYLNLDDGWHGQRDGDGFIHEDPAKFPSGMKASADYVHSKGMKFGLYSDAGEMTCACYSGSLGNEYRDALVYASWGVDYLKYDWCYTPGLNTLAAYTLMRDALRAAGRPIFFSICEWGGTQPWTWAEPIGHSWRTTGDIGPRFEAYEPIYDENGYRSWYPLSVLEIIDLNEPLRAYAGPGHWNDPDMLEVGNGMSVAEDRAHFTMWCMMAAPLLLGNDLRSVTPEVLEIISNRKVIAIDQDSLGIQGFRRRADDGVEFWLKPLADGGWALCLLNRNAEARETEVCWKKLESEDRLSGRSTSFKEKTYTLENLWTAETKPRTTSSDFKVKAEGHDVVLYRLSL